MRDRLSDLQGVQTLELDSMSEPDVGSHHDQTMSEVLQEAEQIGLEIQRIHDDVGELRSANLQTLNQTSHLQDSKRDPNAIGVEIRRGGEGVIRRLRGLEDVGQELESRYGGGHPTTRVARIQHQCLSQALHEAMSRYNDAEMKHRVDCRGLIQRQLEVVGKEASEEELEEMLEGNDWKVFSLQVEGKTARSALVQIESRHQDLLDLERRMEQIQDLFSDVAMLVQEQGNLTENIQKSVQTTGVIVEDGVEHLKRATILDRKNPCRQLFCCCFPCLQDL